MFTEDNEQEIESTPSNTAGRNWLQEALIILSRREHSLHELRLKLKEKGIAADELKTLLDKLILNNWQSEVRYCEMVVRSRSQKGLGPRRAYHDLIQKGIESDLAESHIATVDWQPSLQQCWQKKYNGNKPEGASEYLKQQRFLLQRGFDHEAINKLINK